MELGPAVFQCGVHASPNKEVIFRREFCDGMPSTVWFLSQAAVSAHDGHYAPLSPITNFGNKMSMSIVMRYRASVLFFGAQTTGGGNSTLLLFLSIQPKCEGCEHIVALHSKSGPKRVPCWNHSRELPYQGSCGV